MNIYIYLVGSRMTFAQGYESQYFKSLCGRSDTRIGESFEKIRFIGAVRHLISLLIYT